MRKYTRLLSAAVVGILATAGGAFAAAFTSGNIVVSRIGDVGGTVGGNGTAVYLDEYTTAGSLVQTIALPTVASGNNKSLVLNGTATSWGNLERSADGQFLTIAGINAPVGQVGPTSTSGLKRTVGRIDYNGNVDTSTQLDMAGATPRSVVSVDGSAFWVAADTGSGTSGGIRYVTLGGSGAGTLLSTTVTNVRNLEIYNGQLYVSANVTGFRGVSGVGTGLPTTTGNTITRLTGFADNVGGVNLNTNDFYFADSNTLYVADESATASNGGLQKWTLSAGTWSRTAVFSTGLTTGIRSITGVTSGGVTTIFAITADTAPKLVSFNTTTNAFTTVANSPTGTVFRGVELSAVPVPSAVVIGGLGILALGTRKLVKARRA